MRGTMAAAPQGASTGAEPACDAWHAMTCADLEPRDAGIGDASDAE